MKIFMGFLSVLTVLISSTTHATELLHCTVGASQHQTYAYDYFKSFDLNTERGQISGQYTDAWNEAHALVADQDNHFLRNGNKIQLHIDTWVSHDHIVGDLNLEDGQGTLGVDESLDCLGTAGTTYDVTCTR